MKRVKCYATIGPACADENTLCRMIESGIDGFRLNASHSMLSDCAAWLDALWRAAARAGKVPDLMIDLQGPELRVGKLDEPVTLSTGQTPWLSYAALGLCEAVCRSIERGDVLLLDDGEITLEVMDVEVGRMLCGVKSGGMLRSGKSLCIQGKTVPLPPLSAKDLENLAVAESMGVTEIMQPFVSNGADLRYVRETVASFFNKPIRLYAKIENRAGVENLADILPHCDCVVIARGDLGNAYPLWELPAVQKHIADACLAYGREFMVVTQMLHSMIEKSTPTRAEVSDVFHAVLDGASSVMITGETAVGKYPTDACRYLCRTAEGAVEFVEKHG